MPPDPTCFATLNVPATFVLPECMEDFRLTASPNTNLWRKPPSRDTITAPLMYTAVRRSFYIAEVTVSAEWEMEWDQGGLVIFAGPPPGSSDTWVSHCSNREHQLHTPTTSTKWVKAGLEFTEGTLSASTVVANGPCADWSVMPLYPECLPLPSFPLTNTALRIKLEKVGHNLWIWYQRISSNRYHHFSCPSRDLHSPETVAGTWNKLREVGGFFWGVDEKDIHIGVYASRPATFPPMVGGNGSWNGHSGEAANGLVVEFEDLEILV